MPVLVTSARESAAIDRSAIDAGVPSRALMRVAAANAASVIARRCGERLHHGVTVYTGPGNNGGDGWAVARSLAESGIRVHVCDVVPAATDDAIAECAEALSFVGDGEPATGVIIDAMLGTGARTPLGDPFTKVVNRINDRRALGTYVVALDVPTGLDATTGNAEHSIHADLTITFGSCKRGQLISRAVCGELVVVDIGLGRHTNPALPTLIGSEWVQAQVPHIPANAHKGTRKHLVIIGGGDGMGGAAALAALGALRSGIGLVKVATHAANIEAVQAQCPEALTATLPMNAAAAAELLHKADVVLIGPGLGPTKETRALVERVLAAARVPVVMDADALNVFAGEAAALSAALGGRPAVLTPHPAEFARLVSQTTDTVLENRFEAGTSLALALEAVVLLKGTPTVVSEPRGGRLVSATGTPALATGGSGDVLAGIIATLLAHTGDPFVAAACGAWAHGKAAELCSQTRGVTLHDVLAQLPAVWRGTVQAPSYPVLTDLSAIV